jgi:hypothetical protein
MKYTPNETLYQYGGASNLRERRSLSRLALVALAGLAASVLSMTGVSAAGAATITTPAPYKAPAPATTPAPATIQAAAAPAAVTYHATGCGGSCAITMVRKGNVILVPVYALYATGCYIQVRDPRGTVFTSPKWMCSIALGANVYAWMPGRWSATLFVQYGYPGRSYAYVPEVTVAGNF